MAAKRELTSEWLANWNPTKRQEVADRRCRGLIVRGGPSGAKTFYRFTDITDSSTGKIKRQRVTLGRWSIDGSSGLTLDAAREAFLRAQARKRAEVDGTASKTVADIADQYRKDVLAHREESSREWSWRMIERHVLTAKPDSQRPAFGEWPVRSVKPPDIAAVVRAAKVERTIEVTTQSGKKVTRHLGGPAAARAVLREVKAMFATAVASGGGIESSPAALLGAKSFGLKKIPRGRKLDSNELKALFAALNLSALVDGSEKIERIEKKPKERNTEKKTKKKAVVEERKLSATTRLGIALLFFVPVRSHSLISAQWKEFDLNAGRWTIPVAKLKLHREDRANARPFTVPLPSTAIAILRKLQTLAGESPWVLPSPVDPERHLAPKVLVRGLARLQDSGRIALSDRFTLHDARLTWRTWAGELGVRFEVAEKSLAHVLPGVAETYARADMVAERAEAAELVAAEFDRIRLGTERCLNTLAHRSAAADARSA